MAQTDTLSELNKTSENCPSSWVGNLIKETDYEKAQVNFFIVGEIDDQKINDFDKELRFYVDKEFKNIQIDLTHSAVYSSRVGRIIEAAKRNRDLLSGDKNYIFIRLRKDTFERINTRLGFNYVIPNLSKKISVRKPLLAEVCDIDLQSVVDNQHALIIDNENKSRNLITPLLPPLDAYKAEVLEVEDKEARVKFSDLDGKNFEMLIDRELLFKENADFAGAQLIFAIASLGNTKQRMIRLLNPQDKPRVKLHSYPPIEKIAKEIRRRLKKKEKVDAGTIFS